MTQLSKIKNVFISAGVLWYRNGVDYISAAVSYYTIFALVPLIFISVHVVSILYGEEYTIAVMQEWGTGLGSGIVNLLQEAVQNLDTLSYPTYLPYAGLFVVFSALLVWLNTIANGLHRLFGQKSSGVKAYFKRSFYALVFLVFLEMSIISLIALEFFVALTGSISNLLFSVVYIFFWTILSAISYSLLSMDNHPPLFSRLLGGFVASLLFILGQSLVGLYVFSSTIPNIFDRAGLILVLLLWVYANASIYYFGASFSQAHSEIFSKLNNK